MADIHAALHCEDDPHDSVRFQRELDMVIDFHVDAKGDWGHLDGQGLPFGHLGRKKQ